MLLVLQQNMLLGEAADLVTVPDVVGDSQAAGTLELETALFVVAVQTAYSSTVAAGTIISQSPTAGSEALEGSTVTITVSLGPQTVVPAGSNRKRGPRYYVDIDGQSFPVTSQAEALTLLQRARALAEREAEAQAEVVERKVAKVVRRTGTVPKVRVKAPEISASPELDVSAIVRDIERLYAKAAELAELRLLMRKQMDEDDEELLLL